MPNDELRPGEERRPGPRHAAPRKSVLTKFRIPAGKAMALAAMPTAVFVGMGLTPRLALADDKGDLPFAPGPCVTRSDEPGQEPSGSASPSTKPSPSHGASPGASPSPSATPAPSASAEAEDGTKKDERDGAKEETKAATEAPDATKDGAEASTGAKTGEQPGDEPTASPTPSPSKTKNPLDPLGLGDALKDLFTPKDEQDAEAPAADDKAGDEKAGDGEAAEPKADGSKAAEAGKPADKDTEDAKDTTSEDAKATDPEAKDDKAGDKAGKGDEAGEPRTLKDHLSAAARAAGASEEDIAEGARKAEEQNAKGPQSGKADEAGKGDGPEPYPYPCPTRDAKALADADVDESYPRVAEDPWTLHTTKLSLHGLGYDGIVKVRTASGKVKNVLKFTASGIDIKDLHQTAVGPGAYTTHVKGAPGSTSKIRDGKVTMYTEELKGKLLGLIPVDFTPDSPPPLTLPELFFTDVTVVQAGQFGGTLTIPGLHNYLDKSGS